MNEELALILQTINCIQIFNMKDRTDNMNETEFLMYCQLCQTIQAYERVMELKIKIAMKKYENELEGLESGS